MSIDRGISDRSQVLWGGWCHLPTAFGAEIMAASGFDWCCIDTQHGQIDAGLLFEMVRAVELAGSRAVVRVPGPVVEDIGRSLDAGVWGVLVPNVATVEQAEAAVAASYFQPRGTRSFGTTRAKLYPVQMREIEQEPARCHLMIETAGAMDVVEELAAIPGVAGLFVGPEDLKLGLGVDSEGLVPYLERIAAACADQGIVAGGFAGSIPVKTWRDLGFTFLAVAADSGLLFKAAHNAIAAVQDVAR